MEIGEIKQQMRQDFAENKLNPLQRSLFEPRPAEFLFDIEKDLWETTNLAENPEYQPVLEKMRKLMKKEILESRDVMFLPEYEIALLSGTTSAYEFRLNKEKYPLEEIYDVASLAGFRGNEVASKQMEFLKSPNTIVRYWAILGLRGQNQDDLKSFSDVIFKSMNDTYPPVSVTAASIAYEMFSNKTAEENLKKFCAHENLQISLMAINSPFLLLVNYLCAKWLRTLQLLMTAWTLVSLPSPSTVMLKLLPSSLIRLSKTATTLNS
jgi:hypothetical protein